MSATLAVMPKAFDPSPTVLILEVPESEAQESSNAWNNAGTGHAAQCELNYTPMDKNGNVDISKALKVNTEFSPKNKNGECYFSPKIFLITQCSQFTFPVLRL